MKSILTLMLCLGLLVAASKGVYKVGKLAGKGVVKAAKVLV